MNEDLLQEMRAALAASELAGVVRSLRQDGGITLALAGAAIRPLYPEEIVRLEHQGNYCEDWKRVRVAPGFDWRRVRQSNFHGDVVLGRFHTAARIGAGIELSTGVYHSTVANCVIGNDALIRDVKLLANYIVGEEAQVSNCGSVVCDGQTTFGNGAVLPVGLETGGREAAVYAEITVPIAAAGAGPRGSEGPYHAALAEYLEAVRSTRGVIDRCAVVRDTPRIHNVYVGPFGRVDGATLVEESTLLSGAGESAEILSGACVTGALLQWGSRVATLAVVERSVLIEHARVERHARVTGSILGPNTAIAQGEVTASLLGPFVAAHHQSLTIAVVWPEGKGNVSHGASVGCNHTSRAPDQECRPAEGMFFGLGANVKFPADFRQSPYSVLACGLITQPQQVRFPFSLINRPTVHGPEIPATFNQIEPGWMLSDNLYALARAAAKYRARNRARRSRLEFEVFRPDTVDLMRDACSRLEAVSSIRPVYTRRDVDGLGANFLLENSRLRALEAYRFFIRYYAFLGLKDFLASRPAGEELGSVNRHLTCVSADPRWEHQRRLLVEEFGVRDVVSGLGQLPVLLERFALEVERSRAKDEERGQRTFEDYGSTHVPTRDDPIVVQTWEGARKAQAEVERLLAHWSSPPGPVPTPAGWWPIQVGG